MRIGGFQPFSLVDYPDKMAAIIFTQGCNFRCRYCHNPQLVIPHCYNAPIDEKIIWDFLSRRQHRLEGVVVSGGEPTIQEGLIEFLKQIKQMGFAIKLDTNGSNPDLLQRIIELDLVNYIAMDIKTIPANYPTLVGVKIDEEKILQSIGLIKQSKIDYQFRTTMIKPFSSKENLQEIRKLVGDTKNYKLQMFIPHDELVDPSFSSQGQYKIEELKELLDIKT